MSSIRLEYNELKDKYYLIDMQSKELIETFYGDWALREYLFDVYSMPYEDIDKFITEGV